MESGNDAILRNLLGERLFQQRIVRISGEISQETAHTVVGQLLAMADESEKAIRVFISSPGGHVESGDAIHDVIRFIKAPVDMIGSGWVASAAALIYVAAEKERRYCLPNTRFMIHQPAGQLSGRASELAIETDEILKIRKRINAILAERTGQTIERIEEDTRRNFWLSAQEALDYGLVGRIIESEADIRDDAAQTPSTS